ncbi:MAG: helix-turn-helix domain-containing protein [Candidatus Binatia bacterium]
MTSYLTVGEAAAEFRLSRRSLWRLISTGRIRALRPLRRRVLLRREDLLALVEGAAALEKAR